MINCNNIIIIIVYYSSVKYFESIICFLFSFGKDWLLLMHFLSSVNCFWGGTYWIKVTSLVAQTVKRLPAMWETWVRFLGREGPLEKEMAIHSSTLAWKIPWTEEPDRLQSMGSQRVRHDWATSLSLSLCSLEGKLWPT